MAKKNNDTIPFGAMPVLQGAKKYAQGKFEWTGLNKRYTLDTGDLSAECNMTTEEAPYLVPAKVFESINIGNSGNIALYGFEDFLILLSINSKTLAVTKIAEDKISATTSVVTEISEDVQRSVVLFNVYNDVTDVLSDTNKTRMLLIFPDKLSINVDKFDDGLKNLEIQAKSFNRAEEEYVLTNDTGAVDGKTYYGKTPDGEYMPCEFEEGMSVSGLYEKTGKTIYIPYDNYSKKKTWYNTENQTYYSYNTDTESWEGSKTLPAFPDIDYAATYLSRLFGVKDGKVYVSGYNDYANWNLDTIDEYLESNAWASDTQAGSKAGGKFTGIIVYDGHVVCFKRDFMHEIYNTKNPFRVYDIYADGAIDNRSIQVVGSKLVFVSAGGVKVYTGGMPREIGYNLGINEFTYAVAGSDDRFYYLYCKDESENAHFFVYDSFFEVWSERETPGYDIISFAHNDKGMYYLTSSGIYKLEENTYCKNWSFETDFSTALSSDSRSIDIKHISKIQILADFKSGASLKVYADYNNEGFDEENPLIDITVTAEENEIKRIPIRIKPLRSANYGFKLRFEGSGYVKFYSMVIYSEQGGESFISGV